MKSLKRKLNICLTVFIALFTLNTNALDQMAKEEVTPPPAENALTTEQLLPQFSTDKEKKQQALNTLPQTPEENNTGRDVASLFKTG